MRTIILITRYTVIRCQCSDAIKFGIDFLYDVKTQGYSVFPQRSIHYLPSVERMVHKVLQFRKFLS